LRVMKNDAIQLTSSNERLLMFRLQNLQFQIAFDIYIKIKTIVERCIEHHQISLAEIEQIFLLLEEAKNKETEEEETVDQEKSALAANEKKQDNGFLLLHHEHFVRFHAMLMRLYKQKERKNSNRRGMHWR